MKYYKVLQSKNTTKYYKVPQKTIRNPRPCVRVHRSMGAREAAAASQCPLSLLLTHFFISFY